MNAWALFTVKKGNDEVKKIYQQIVNNAIEISFANEDTDGLAPGNYEYDVRVMINPTLGEDGYPITGQFVRTPKDPIPFIIERTVGIV